jgi:biopolymer transport protein ExbB
MPKFGCSGVRPGLEEPAAMRQNKCNIITFSLVLAGTGAETAMANVPGSLLPQNLSPWGMFMSADIIVQAVMVGLAFASLVTWTVWLAKTVELARETSKAKKRIRMLEKGPSLAEAARVCGEDNDAVAQIVRTAAREASLSGDDFGDGFRERAELRIERVQQAMSRKTTSLAVVAPGIAEALLATALGLVAAIPAVVIYNHLARSTAAYRTLLGDAAAQVMLMISRDQSRRTIRLGRAAE